MKNRPDIVLVVLDSVRAQSCSVHGYGRRTSPFLERLADEGAVVYDNAISTTVSTVPAHASIFTGTHVSRHELFVDGDTLTPTIATLAECLTAAGYRTYGVCYQDDVSPSTGLHRGFERFEMEDEPGPLHRAVRHVLTTPPGVVPPRAPRDASPPERKVNETPSFGAKAYKQLFWHGTRFIDQGARVTQRKAERFLDSLDPDQNFFMYLHYDEAHLPYRPPGRYRDMFLSARQRARAALVNQDRTAYYCGDAPMQRADFDILSGLYDGAIAFLDARMRDLHEMLARRHAIDNTLFIIMGDHGDSIGEHGLMSHKFCVYDTLTRVLLVVKYPNGLMARGRRVDAVVQHTDILQTVLDLTHLPETGLPQKLQGNSLVSRSIWHRPSGLAISELVKPFGREAWHARERMRQYDRRLFAVRSQKHKFIYASDGRHEFYDVLADPLETCNLLDGTVLPIEAERLRRVAEAHRPAFDATFNRHKHRM